MHAHTEIHRHASFFLKKKKEKTTTKPPQFRLKGNCSRDKLFEWWRCCQLQLKAPLLHGPPVELGFPSHGGPTASSPPWHLARTRCSGGRAGRRLSLATEPLQKHQLHAPPSPFPSLALCVLLAGPPLPCPAPPALLPLPPAGVCGGGGLHPGGCGAGTAARGGGERQVSDLRLRTRWADRFERWAEGCKIGWF